MRKFRRMRKGNEDGISDGKSQSLNKSARELRELRGSLEGA